MLTTEFNNLRFVFMLHDLQRLHLADIWCIMFLINCKRQHLHQFECFDKLYISVVKKINRDRYVIAFDTDFVSN